MFRSLSRHHCSLLLITEGTYADAAAGRDHQGGATVAGSSARCLAIDGSRACELQRPLLADSGGSGASARLGSLLPC